MSSKKVPESEKSEKPCPYCKKHYTFFKVLGNPGYCSKPKCQLLAMRAGL